MISFFPAPEPHDLTRPHIHGLDQSMPGSQQSVCSNLARLSPTHENHGKSHSRRIHHDIVSSSLKARQQLAVVYSVGEQQSHATNRAATPFPIPGSASSSYRCFRTISIISS
jgi:hypothetical protein